MSFVAVMAVSDKQPSFKIIFNKRFEGLLVPRLVLSFLLLSQHFSPDNKRSFQNRC